MSVGSDRCLCGSRHSRREWIGDAFSVDLRVEAESDGVLC